MNFSQVLDALSVDIQNAKPNEVVKRSFKERHNISNEDLVKGYWIVMANGGSSFNSPITLREMSGELGAHVIFMFLLPEGSEGIEIENRELQAVNDLVDILDQATGTSRCFDFNSYVQSAQLEAPYGFVAFSLTWKELD